MCVCVCVCVFWDGGECQYNIIIMPCSLLKVTCTVDQLLLFKKVYCDSGVMVGEWGGGGGGGMRWGVR